MVIATTRPRTFIEYCNTLSKSDDLENWQRGAAKSFTDTEKALTDYDSGKYVYAPTGGGGVLIPSFFGEACIPPKYVEAIWSQLFSRVGYISEVEHGSFDQEVIYAMK